jgi:hypothetical protein
MPHFNLNNPDSAKRIANLMERRTANLVKMAGVEFFQQVIISTPLDTGRARFGWYGTVNTPSDYLPPPAPDNWKGKSKGGSEYYPVPDIATHMNIGTITVSDKIYITNRVPYIKKLNAGSSKQFPARFVEIAAEKVQRAISRLWRKIK